MTSTLWLASAAAMLPATALVAWLRYAADPTDAEMDALVRHGGPCFNRLDCVGTTPDSVQPILISPAGFLQFPLFLNPGLTP